MRLFIPLLASPVLLLASCGDSGPADAGAQPSAQPQWNVQDVDPAAAQKLMAENPNVRVLDVRTPEEYAEGHIKGAINVDFKASGFAGEVAKLDKNKSYIVHCRSGNRSGKSLPVLKQQGFGAIYHLNKGFNAWQEAGMAVEH
jgi:rhodanese-related sulfurtransferase